MLPVKAKKIDQDKLEYWLQAFFLKFVVSIQYDIHSDIVIQFQL